MSRFKTSIISCVLLAAIGLLLTLIHDQVNSRAEAQGMCIDIFNIWRSGGGPPPFSYGMNCGDGSNADSPIGNNVKRLCYLTRAGFEDVDSDGEWTTCQVYQSGALWRMACGSRSDSNSFCNAMCIQWNY